VRTRFSKSGNIKQTSFVAFRHKSKWLPSKSLGNEVSLGEFRLWIFQSNQPIDQTVSQAEYQ
jgi:hypothetical protein